MSEYLGAKMKLTAEGRAMGEVALDMYQRGSMVEDIAEHLGLPSVAHLQLLMSIYLRGADLPE